MLKCKQITELASNNLDTSIPWLKRFEMKLHLMMCKACFQYVKQIEFIQRVISKIDKQGEKTILSADAKNRIQAKLNQSHTQ
jgi:predicted anti-sigma-YlaC factor YlaD